MADIFISYAREDAARVGQLTEALEAAGYSVWWDHKLVSGARYLKETETQLRAAKATVVVWSKTSIDSHWVADEAALARDLGRLAPISIDGVMPPLGFGQYQVTDFSHWHGGQGEPLNTLLRALAEKTGHAPPGAAPETPRAKTAPPTWMIAGGAIGLVIAAVAIWFVAVREPAGEAKAPASIAVRPFADLSANGDQAYLANGVTSEILARLRGVENITVVGGDWIPKLVDELKGDPMALGERLSVAHLLEGDVQAEGTKLRINARLTRTRDGKLVWAQKYDQETSSIFAIQDEIALKVADALSVALDVGLQSTSYGGTRSFEAYDHYLRGRALRNINPPSRSVDELEQAVAIDPGYARAWSELTIAYGTVARMAGTPDALKPAVDKMDRASAQAEQLAPETWFAHTARGWYFLAVNDWVGADAAHRRALQLGDVPDPEFYNTELAFASQVGRVNEMIRLRDKRHQLDPRYSDRYIGVIQASLQQGDFKQARSAYEQAHAEAPGNFLVEYYGLWAALGAGDKAKAREILMAFGKQSPRYTEIASMLDAPDRMIAAMRRTADGPSPGRGELTTAALLAGQYGAPDLAVELLRKAYLGPGWAGQFLIWFLQLREARQTPAFKAFVSDAGFVAMWRASGDWGDYCRPLEGEDFTCT